MERKTSILAFMDSLSPERRMWTADCLLIFCAALWGIGFVAVKEALDTYPTFWLLSLRFGGATLILGGIFFKRMLKADLKDLLNGSIIGIFLFLGMGIQTLGLNYTTAGKQAFLTASYVIFVPLILWMMRGIFPGWTATIASLVCFLGMGLLTSDSSGPLNIGDILTMISAIFFAMQIIAIGRYTTKGDPLVLTVVQFLVASLASLAIAPFAHGAFVFRGAQGMPQVLFTMLFCTMICFLIQNIAQKYTLSTHASILLGLESVFGLLGGILILGEAFTFRIGLGCFLILAAVLLVELAPAFLRSLQTLPQQE